LEKYKKKFNEHRQTKFYKSSVMRADNFIAVNSIKRQIIVLKLDLARAIQIDQNIKRLILIV